MLSDTTTASISKRLVKPCAGVPGIRLNAEGTVSMTAALSSGGRASPVHKVSWLLRGSRAEQAPRMRKDKVAMVENGTHERRAWLEQEDRRM